MDWIVNLAGLAVIGLVVWWFWLAQPRARRAQGDVIEVVVADGVYTPPRIEVAAGAPVRLRFLRKDPSACAEKVLFDELGVSADLALGRPTEVTVVAPKPGEYVFTCQMRMYRGSLVAR